MLVLASAAYHHVREEQRLHGFSESAIKTHGLAKSFLEVCGLSSLGLTVPRYSVFGFRGPTGAGKTLKLLLGLIRSTAGGGRIFRQDIVRDSVSIRSRVGLLPQQPRFG